MARVYSRGEKRIFDLRTRQSGGREGQKNGRVVEETIRGRWEKEGGVCISRQRKMRAEEEGEKACSTRVSLIAFISKRGVLPSLWHHHPGFCSSQKHRQHREYTLTYTHAHTHTHARAVLDLFRSSIILFYFLVRHCLARSYLLIYRPPLPQRRFIFIYEPMPSIPFYLSSFFFYSLRFLLFFGPHPLGIIIDVSSDATHAATF